MTLIESKGQSPDMADDDLPTFPHTRLSRGIGQREPQERRGGKREAHDQKGLAIPHELDEQPADGCAAREGRHVDVADGGPSAAYLLGRMVHEQRLLQREDSVEGSTAHNPRARLDGQVGRQRRPKVARGAEEQARKDHAAAARVVVLADVRADLDGDELGGEESELDDGEHKRRHALLREEEPPELDDQAAAQHAPEVIREDVPAHAPRG
eukprot:CAMPEP_0115853480 /NCGR_PEP_ID=MMETSP0287-20121206/13525_1 /TAXON_ID=412157 /ORGANISM="Chrysochromulina rotalis, Strain UIO044" /LENGTH=210 /DNA_ID=CAMNT_0003307557 /DNA_START=171 /DNA_END=801 /DNA_ORIENTATION=-